MWLNMSVIFSVTRFRMTLYASAGSPSAPSDFCLFNSLFLVLCLVECIPVVTVLFLDVHISMFVVGIVVFLASFCISNIHTSLMRDFS